MGREYEKSPGYEVMIGSVKLGCYYLVQFTTTFANDCLVLSIAAESITSDSVMPSNGSFFTVVNTFDLERKIRRGVN